MKILLFLLLVSGTNSIAAPDFEQVFGGSEVDRGIHVDLTDDGGFVVVGSTRSLGEGAEDVYLVRTDSQGKEIWSRTFGGADEDFGWSIHQVGTGFIIAGFTQSFGNGQNDFYLIKATADGEKEWARTFGGEGNDRCWALAPTVDGGFLLAGETTSLGEGEEDFFLVKTDSLGTQLWSQTYGGSESDRCFAVAQADDGGFVLAGQTFSEGAGDRDAFVVKTSAEGEMEWSRTYGGEASDVGHGIARTADGNFLVTGYTTSFGVQGDDAYLMKVDSLGNTLWTRVIPLEGNNHTLSGDQASDGGFYLIGFSEYRGRGNTAALLIKTDFEGRMTWSRDIHFSNLGETFGYSVRGTADGGCVFTGHATAGTAGNLDVLLVGVSGNP